MQLVLIPTKLEKIAKDLLVQKGFNVVQDAETPLAEQAKKYPETEALIVRSEKVTKEIMVALPKLRTVIRAGAGYDNIDTKAARKQGVDVMNTPGANANGVAEEVIAMVLAHYRQIIPADATTRAGKWEKKNYMGREITGKTLGIIGLGAIGRLVAKRLSGFEVKVLGFDPVISAAKAAEIGAELAPLEKIFAESDIISLHVPATPETKGMVNAALLGLCKPGVVIVNCARSEIINEADLRALKADKKLGFCNDVYAEDAAGPKSCADIADVMLPHLGATTLEANNMAARRAAEQLMAYAERGVTTYVVNKGVPDGLDEKFQQLAYHVAFVARALLGANNPIREIECSFYGDLHKFAKWFLPPIVAAVATDVKGIDDPKDAESYLADKGIAVKFREIDHAKKYGNSMTIDLVGGGEGALAQVSVRGTIAEGNLMISRINDFDKLYFTPSGDSLIAIYQDRPGVLAKITAALAAAGINIEDIRCPHDLKGIMSVAVVKTNKPVPAETVERIRREVEAKTVAALTII